MVGLAKVAVILIVIAILKKYAEHVADDKAVTKALFVKAVRAEVVA